MHALPLLAVLIVAGIASSLPTTPFPVQDPTGLVGPSWAAWYDRGSTDLGRDVAIDASGAVLVAGSSYKDSVVGSQPLIVKWDAAGERAWVFLGRDGAIYDRVAAMPDGSVVAAGRDCGYWFLDHLSGQGALLWERTFPSGGCPRIQDLVAEPDGMIDLLMFGTLHRFAPDGTLLWARPTNAIAEAIAPTAIGPLVAGGDAFASDLRLFDTGGNLVASRHLDDTYDVHGAARVGARVVLAGDPVFAVGLDLSTAWSLPLASSWVAAAGDRAVIVSDELLLGLGADGDVCSVSARPAVDFVGGPVAHTVLLYHLYGDLPGELELHAMDFDGAHVAFGGDRWGGDGFHGWTGYFDAYAEVDDVGAATC
ncbi:MAG: hypothetical protein LC624_10245 [Halobacteriales archaeon]|nr:hypothetical protein [Halobacteriales archaeon]